MKYFIGVLIVFISLGTFKVQANNEYSKFFPKLYSGIWPNVCLEHMKKFPNECSEQHINESGRVFLDYIEEGNSEYFVDYEIISKLFNYLYLIPNNSKCDFRYCNNCHKPVIRGSFSYCYVDEEEEEDFFMICYKCKCLNYWYNENDQCINNEEDFIEKYWIECRDKAYPNLYFDISSKQYISFFENYLKYCYENSTCLCYWPFLSKIACEISDTVYENTYSLLELDDLLLDELQNSVKYPYFRNCTTHGALVYLFTHSFFYSQYREILLNLAQFSEANSNINIVKVLNIIYKILDKVMPKFVNLYSQCLEKHPHPKIFYERGMAYFHQGKNLEAMNDIGELVSYAEENNFEDLLTSDLYFKEGESYAELGLYDQAIEKLTKAIQKDPNNKEAYLERSFAYFELGKFDVAIEDFLQVNVKFNSISSEDKNSLTFAKGLIFGLIKGGKDGSIEFVPSILSSLHGLGNGLWAFVCEPINCSKDVINACQNCVKFIKENSSKEIIKEFIPELKELSNNWDNLNNEKKGDLTGYIIGKYGIDILMTSGSVKAVKYYKDLKKANAIFTLEKISRDTQKAQIIFNASLKKYEKVEAITKTFDLVNINPKIYLQLERQFLKDGKESIYKGLKKAEKTLQQHQDKLPSLKHKSQVQGTIKNIERQVETIKKFIKDKGLSE